MSIRLTDRGRELHEGDIDELETKLKLTLPAGYRDFLLAHNVAKPEPNRYQTGGVTTSVQRFLGVSQDANADLAEQNLTTYSGRLPFGFLAVAEASGGNLICIRTRDEAVFFWDHELEAAEDEGPSLENMKRLAGSFPLFLEALQPFDPKSVVLDPKQVISVKVKPGFLEKFKKKI